MEESVPQVPQTPKPNPFTTVTPLSKALALILFIALPFLGFYLGMLYHGLLSPVSQPTISNVPSRVTSQTQFPFSNLNNQATPAASSELANWKMYTNAKYGFSFMYPPDYILGSCRSCFDLSVAPLVTLDPPETEKSGRVMIVNIKDKLPSQTLYEYFQNMGGKDSSSVVLAEVRKFTLNGREAIETLSNESGFGNRGIIISKGVMVISIDFSAVNSSTTVGVPIGDLNNAKKFDQILSTFKFLP